MARWDLMVRRVRFLATSCGVYQPPFLYELDPPLSVGLDGHSNGMGDIGESQSYLRDTLAVLSSEENSP